MRRAARSPVYSDRFIPSRAASSRLQGFSLLDRAEAAQDVARHAAFHRLHFLARLSGGKKECVRVLLMSSA